MGWPTDTQIDQAAESLCRMAEVPGLDRGRAVFKAPDFRRVEWYLPQEVCAFGGIGDVEAYIPSATAYDDRGELFERCRFEIVEGFHDRADCASQMLPACFEKAKRIFKQRGEHLRPDEPNWLRAMAAMLSDDVAEREWREQIDAEWPRLSLVDGE